MKRLERGDSAPNIAFAFALLSMLIGCTTTVEQRHYLAVPSGDDTNYYRVDMRAKTTGATTEFHSGWYPAEAVDALFGIADDNVEELKTRIALKEQINLGLQAVMTEYIREAQKPDASPERLAKLIEARKRMRAAPTQATPLPATAVEMEYNPEASLVLRHAGEKFVMVLSARPSEVSQEIVNFVDSQKTSVSVSRLADVISHRVVDDVAELEASNASDDKVDQIIASEMSRVLEALPSSSSDVAAALRELEALRVLIGGVE